MTGRKKARLQKLKNILAVEEKGDKVLFTTCFAQKNNREVFMDFARDSVALIWQEYAKDQDALKHCEFSRNFKVISGFMTKVTTLWDKARRVAKVGST